ncbi:DUF262 domain-containing protein [Hymenobacter sp. UYP22]|uniref:DUF262 domain-containing protein n=1 Tax=Hymenobacter sp. UYP22 TaxID=3156348 RepID=UPI003395A5B6
MTDEQGFDNRLNPNEIDISVQQLSLYYLLERLKNNEIDLFADYQRSWNVWDRIKQSRLIESILIRIPIPAFYFDSSQGSKWQVVDGLQRVSTFYNYIIGQNFKLTGLEFLTEFEGYYYRDLPKNLQRRIEEFTLTIYMINRGTPADVKYAIFSRINTGGVNLNSQELRFALNQGESTNLLQELSSHTLFRNATYNSINGKRMDDYELINRFIAFYLNYDKYSGNLDTFMNDALNIINKQHYNTDYIKDAFLKSMHYSIEIFGDNRFKIPLQKYSKNTRVNKALFDTISVNLAWLSKDELENLVKKRVAVTENLLELFNDFNFLNSIRSSTNTKSKVQCRFEMVRHILNFNSK